MQQHLQKTEELYKKNVVCFLPIVRGRMLDGRNKCDEQEIGEGVVGWVGGESKSRVRAARTFFVIRRKCSRFLCLQLVSLKSAETSLREGFK